jgi:hypothetical protein
MNLSEQTEMVPRRFSVREVAEMLVKQFDLNIATAQSYIYNDVHAGKIKVVRQLGFPTLVEAPELQRYLNNFRTLHPKTFPSSASRSIPPSITFTTKILTPVEVNALRSIVVHALGEYLKTMPESQREDAGLALVLEAI